MSVNERQLGTYVTEIRRRFEDLLGQMVEIPSISMDPTKAPDIRRMAELARQEGFQLSILPLLEIRGHQVSSTCIRELIVAGQVHIASRLLGRPFSTYGPIVAGMGVGHKHTVPTLNLAPIEEQIPKIGVYVTRTILGDTAHDSVTNVGYRPTFGAHELTIETHLLHYTGNVTESEMQIVYLYRLRDEMKFQNPAILKIQILEDTRRALKFFRLLETFRPLGAKPQPAPISGSHS